MKLNHSLRRTIALLAVLLPVSCSFNLFNPMDAKIAKLDADGLIQEGQKRIQLGDYETALVNFRNARILDPSKSEAWYGEAKVAYLRAGFNIVVLVDAFQGSDTSLPFFDWNMERQNRLYEATRIARSALIRLVKDTLGSDMVIRPNWVKADFAITVAIHAVLRLKDFNGDSTINAMDDPIKFLQIRVDSNGIHMVNFDSLVATPEGRAQFNGFLDGAASLITETCSDVAVFFPAADSAEKYQEVVSELADKITWFKVGDLVDNDGDWFDTDGDTIMDPMVWTDLDGDKCIDLGPGHQHLQLRLGLLGALPNYVRLPSGSITYTGQPSGEWISGDFGVDEEDRDLFDNDGDLIPDEDSRTGP